MKEPPQPTRAPSPAPERGVPPHAAPSSAAHRAPAGSFRPEQLLHLQRTLGNRAVGQLLRRAAPPLRRVQASGPTAAIQRSPVLVGTHVVPGTEEEDTEAFMLSLGEYSRDELQSILVALRRGISPWDLRTADQLAQWIDIFVTDEPPPQPQVRWEDKESTGKLVSQNGWWVRTTYGYEYLLINAEEIPKELLVERTPIAFRRPFHRYKVSEEMQVAILRHGVVAVRAAETPLPGTVPQDVTEYIAFHQAAARDDEEIALASRGDRNRYKPRYVGEMGYAVAWGGPAKSLVGKTQDRKMVKSMDTTYTPTGATAGVTIPGETVHSGKLWRTDPLHGNEIRVAFGLFYATASGTGFSQGKVVEYGSGKTESGTQAKHDNADEIASMLVDSGQLASVDQYDDEKHSHSEQQMIVHLSRDLSAFDAPMAHAIKQGATQVVALVVDLFSSPNTVCDTCHPSLETFLTRSDWKDRIAQRLGEIGSQAGVGVASPQVILRASANKTFTATATQALKTATDTYNVQQGGEEIHFTERVPYHRY